MSKKRRREQPAVDLQLVEIYEDLANVDEKVRLKAAHALLKKFVCEQMGSGEQLNGILRRLIRGLCSGRKAARLGFSIALTEILSELLGPNKDKVLGFQSAAELVKTLVDQTSVSGDVSGQEERDHQFGRLFGAESIIESRILFQPHIDTGVWGDVLGIVCALAVQKSWLREECGFVLFKALQATAKDDSTYAQSIIDKLRDHNLLRTPEGIVIWITAKRELPSLKFPAHVWKHENPLDRKETSSLARILREGAIVDTNDLDAPGSKMTQQSIWSTKVHFAWDSIIAQLSYDQPAGIQKNSKGTKNISFEEFWEECVDNSLFTNASSAERKFWGFLLFQKNIGNVPLSAVPKLFTRNFMRCLINQLGSSGRFLHRAAEKSVSSILERASRNLEIRAPILKALLTEPFGDVNFDKITGTKLVETILSQMRPFECEPIISLYEELILNPGVQDEKVAASRRLVLGDQLVSALRRRHIESTDNDCGSKNGHVVRSILQLLATFAYFDHANPTGAKGSTMNPSFSPNSRQIYRTRISTCLGHLLATSNDPASYVYNMVRTFRYGDRDFAYGQLLLEADGTVSKVLTSAWAVVEKANLEAEKESPEVSKGRYLRSIILLYSITILEVHNEDADAVSILEELNDIFEEDAEGNKSATGTAALVEILLSFASKSSQLFRRMTQQVFASCTSDIDDACLEALIKVLETKENTKGQTEMFAQNNEDEKEDVSSSEASDVGEIESFESESESDSEDVADSGIVSGSSDKSEGSDNEVAAFDKKLAQALRTRPGDGDSEADDSSSSDSDMNDEEMEALDEPLAKIFREHQNLMSKKNEKKNAKETVINLKCRVLELMGIYVKQQSSNLLALGLLVPVLAVIRTTTSPLVSSKACELIREYSKLCKRNGLPQVEDFEAMFDLLEEVHAEAGREASNAHASACSQASLLIVRALVSRDREHLKYVIKVYAATQGKWLFDSGCKVKKLFFTEWVVWCDSVATR